MPSVSAGVSCEYSAIGGTQEHKHGGAFMRKVNIVAVAAALFVVFCLVLPLQVTAEKITPFSLRATDGRLYDLAAMKDCPMLILYFFDPASSSCQEGMIWLNQIREKYSEMDVEVWAVTAASAGSAKSFCSKVNCNYPVLIDDKGVGEQCNAATVLPTVLILGPDLLLLDRIQGGGKGPEVMVVRIAERELQRRHAALAEKLGEEAVKRDPDNIEAHVVTGYAALQEGKADMAEKIFSSVASKPGKGEILGTEGLAAVYEYKGDAGRAVEFADRVSRKAPARAYPHVIKGNILYAKGKKAQAQKEFKSAVDKPEAEPFQQGVRFNQLGRMYAENGKYKQARELYDRAVAIDPYYVEGMANKGVTYEKEGRWDKALSAYQKALSMDREDRLSALLAQKAKEMLELQKDIARSRRIDKLVKELAERYRQQKELPPPEDQWTSRPMVLSFLDFQEKGGLSERDGISIFFTSQLSDYLNSSGRVKVVERVILDKLLQELNLGSSDLADRQTALKLGRVLAAKLISAGSFYYLPAYTLLSMRMIDTETSAIAMVENRRLQSIDTGLLELNRKILKTIIEKYPLRGYIIQPEGSGQVLINIGARQGVVMGSRFKAVVEAEPIIYKGRKLSAGTKKIGVIEVVKVEPDLAYCKVVEKERPLKRDDKIIEIPLGGDNG